MTYMPNAVYTAPAPSITSMEPTWKLPDYVGSDAYGPGPAPPVVLPGWTNGMPVPPDVAACIKLCQPWQQVATMMSALTKEAMVRPTKTRTRSKSGCTTAAALSAPYSSSAPSSRSSTHPCNKLGCMKLNHVAQMAAPTTV